jgi:hypothetical protein
MFSFRYRITLPAKQKIEHGTRSALLPCPEPGKTLRLSGLAMRADPPSSPSPPLELWGSSWPSRKEAAEAGRRYAKALMRTLVRSRHGAEYHFDIVQGGMSDAARETVEDVFGQPVIDDNPGLTVFASHPSPQLMGIDFDMCSSMPWLNVEHIFTVAAEDVVALSSRERLAFDLYNASFFETSHKAQLVMRVMAIETILSPEPRRLPARQHVESLIKQTLDSQHLLEAEKQSLTGSLQWLLNESISSAGKKLAQARLGERKYTGRNPASFFSHCYGVRSLLVHGSSDAVESSEVSMVNHALSEFVSDLLSGPLLSLEYPPMASR